MAVKTVAEQAPMTTPEAIRYFSKLRLGRRGEDGQDKGSITSPFSERRARVLLLTSKGFQAGVEF